MHFWPSKSIVKSSDLFRPASRLSKIPKGTTPEEWKKTVAEFKMDKLVIMNKVPKISKKIGGDKKD